MSIEERLAALEGEARRARSRARRLALAPLALLLLAAADSPETVRARRVEIVDEAGRVVVAIDAGGIQVRNDDGRAVVQIAGDEQGDGYIGVFSRLGFGKTLQPRPSQYVGVKAD